MGVPGKRTLGFPIGFRALLEYKALITQDLRADWPLMETQGLLASLETQLGTQGAILEVFYGYFWAVKGLIRPLRAL